MPLHPGRSASHPAVPPAPFHIHRTVCPEGDAFARQQQTVRFFSHGLKRSAQFSASVHHPVTGHICRRAVHGISDNAGKTRAADHRRDLPIGGHASCRNPPHHAVYLFKHLHSCFSPRFLNQMIRPAAGKNNHLVGLCLLVTTFTEILHSARFMCYDASTNRSGPVQSGPDAEGALPCPGQLFFRPQNT